MGVYSEAGQRVYRGDDREVVVVCCLLLACVIHLLNELFSHG
jgi:hypothetical protein